MIRINLIRGKRKKRRELDFNIVYFVIPGVVLAGLFLFHRMETNRIRTIQANIAKANTEIERLKKEIGEVEKFKARKAELQQKVDIISNLQTGRTLPVKQFEAVSAAIPEKCWIDKLEMKTNQITLSGIALNNHTIANFMTALGQSGRFNNVVLGTAEQTTVMGVKLMKFNLTFETLPK
jgi:type IV pilus assembly protein PilN